MRAQEITREASCVVLDEFHERRYCLRVLEAPEDGNRLEAVRNRLVDHRINLASWLRDETAQHGNATHVFHKPKRHREVRGESAAGRHLPRKRVRERTPLAINGALPRSPVGVSRPFARGVL